MPAAVVSGAPQLIARTRLLRRLVDLAGEAGVEATGAQLAAQMRARAPRAAGGATRSDLGHGADSIVAVDGKELPHVATKDVGPTAYWMRFQEFGTIHHSAQPFMRPAAAAQKRVMPRTLRAFVTRALRTGTAGVR